MNRTGTRIQLYHQTATQVDLSGKDVLEVSCGHGGGASYLTRTLHPASYTALDFNAAGIDFCQKRHDLPGLKFVQGDAQNLPFPDESFDAVINVEASHIYPNFERFLGEVARVLRPGGHFLYADFRNRDAFVAWEAALTEPPACGSSPRKSSMSKLLRGLQKNSPRSTELINRYLAGVRRAASAVNSLWWMARCSIATWNAAKSPTAPIASQRTEVRTRSRARSFQPLMKRRSMVVSSCPQWQLRGTRH